MPGLTGDLAPKIKFTAICTNAYIERDGSRTECTRELNHYGACYWPQLPEWRRRAMKAKRDYGYVAVKELGR